MARNDVPFAAVERESAVTIGKFGPSFGVYIRTSQSKVGAQNAKTTDATWPDAFH